MSFSIFTLEIIVSNRLRIRIPPQIRTRLTTSPPAGPKRPEIAAFSHQVLCTFCFSCNQRGLIHTWAVIFLSWLWDKQRGSLLQHQLEANPALFRKCPRCCLLHCSVIKPQQEWMVNCNPWMLEQQPHCGDPGRATPTAPHPPVRRQVTSSCLSWVALPRTCCPGKRWQPIGAY